MSTIIHTVDRTRPVEKLKPSAGSAAEAAAPLVTSLLGPDLPMLVSFWDGSSLGRPDGLGVLHVRSADAIKRIIWAPGELGLGRAYVAGDLDWDGNLFELIEALRELAPSHLNFSPAAIRAALTAARQTHAIGAPPPRPAEEAGGRGRLHSMSRDSRSVRHHYDVGNEFYRLILGPAMTYSCARFVTPETTLLQAQDAKHELICRKLGLAEHPGTRLLDVGCGWGSLALHAARHHHATVVGITISPEQADEARRRVAAERLDDLVEIRLQDYRDLGAERFDAISSVGMFEHVGAARVAQYFATLHRILEPQGRLLNHAISSVGNSTLGRRSFIGRYVFPDGELIDVGQVVLAMERAGFEVRDVESLREHYARTLRAWVANLTEQWDEAVALVGEARVRVWHLYMVGSAVGFEDGGVAIHQTLGVVPSHDGTSDMPATRVDWR